jgi:hypothetical protein
MLQQLLLILIQPMIRDQKFRQLLNFDIHQHRHHRHQMMQRLRVRLHLRQQLPSIRRLVSYLH